MLKILLLNHSTYKYDIELLYLGLLWVLNHFSSVRFCAIPWTVAYQAPGSMGFSRQEHWSGLPFLSPAFLTEESAKETTQWHLWLWPPATCFSSIASSPSSLLLEVSALHCWAPRLKRIDFVLSQFNFPDFFWANRITSQSKRVYLQYSHLKEQIFKSDCPGSNPSCALCQLWNPK